MYHSGSRYHVGLFCKILYEYVETIGDDMCTYTNLWAMELYFEVLYVSNSHSHSPFLPQLFLLVRPEENNSIQKSQFGTDRY